MLAIAGGKGGCGKTTTALGLAASLDDPVLVADCDVDMPNLHALADVPPDPTLAAVAGGGDPTRLARRPAEASNVGVLPAPDAETSLDAALARLDGVDAPVLLDCPAGAGPDAARPLDAADGVVVVSTLCAPALRDAAKTAAMARAVGTPVLGAVLTRTRLAPPAVSNLLDCPVLTSVPPADSVGDDTGSGVLGAAVVRTSYTRLADRLELGKE